MVDHKVWQSKKLEDYKINPNFADTETTHNQQSQDQRGILGGLRFQEKV